MHYCTMENKELELELELAFTVVIGFDSQPPCPHVHLAEYN